jgi:anti-anti-sigma factor
VLPSILVVAAVTALVLLLRLRRERGGSLTTQVVGDVLVIQPPKHLTGSWDNGELGATLSKALERGQRRIVVDMSRVRHVNSFGLGTLVGAEATIRQAGGIMVFGGLDAHVARVFDTTKISSRLVTVSSLDEAVGRARSDS